MRRKLATLLFVIVNLVQINGTKAQIKVTNLTDDFLNYYQTTKDSPDESKIKKFQEQIYKLSPSVYKSIYKDIKWMGREPEDQLLKCINEFSRIEKKYAKLSKGLDTRFVNALSSFQKTFPDFKPNFDVCILHSLGIRAGGPVGIQEKKVLMFGVDQMAKYFDFKNFEPFFHHELTHLYHDTFFTPVEKEKYTKNAIYNYLWKEGMAVYVSSVLNPDANKIEIFMRDSLSQKTEKVLKIAAKELSKNLYSSDKEIIRKYFWGSSTDKVIPKTAGYYIGYLLVKEMAKKHPLNELIKLKEDEFVPEFKEILIRLGNC